MSRMRIIAALVVTIAVVLVSTVFALQIGQSAPSFMLQDQFNKTWSLIGQRNSVVALVVADRDSGRLMGPWVEKLKSSYGSKIQVLGLLDLHSVPGIGRGIAKSRIRSETKDPLMLDWRGDVAKVYTVSSKHPVVVVIDGKGVIRAIQATTFTPQACNAISAAIDSALKPAGTQQSGQ